MDANTLSLSGGGFGCNDEDNPATPTEDGTDGGPGEGTDSEDEHPRYDTDAPATPMNIPVPNNRLVAFTLAGALLTTVVAAGLAFPGLGFATTGDTGNAVSDADASTSQQLAGDAPAPNQNFTPAVQTQSGYEEGEHEEAEHEEGEGGDEHEEAEEEHEEAEAAEEGEE
ncbi:hypothetical protein [Halobacterium hubeiense]|nr:hypothetical protein [Halobacterium hubeiense]